MQFILTNLFIMVIVETFEVSERPLNPAGCYPSDQRIEAARTQPNLWFALFSKSRVEVLRGQRCNRRVLARGSIRTRPRRAVGLESASLAIDADITPPPSLDLMGPRF